jgi:hypothetical protein
LRQFCIFNTCHRLWSPIHHYIRYCVTVLSKKKKKKIFKIISWFILSFTLHLFSNWVFNFRKL